jgi:hypothetical protein
MGTGFVPFHPVTFQQHVPFHFDVAGALTYVDSMNSFDATFCLQLRMTHLLTNTSDRPRSGRPRVTTLRQDRHIRFIHLRNRFVTAVHTARLTPGRTNVRISDQTVHPIS